MAMRKCPNTSVCQDASDDDQPCGGLTDTSVRRRSEHSSAGLDGPPDGDTERAPSEGVSNTFNVQAIESDVDDGELESSNPLRISSRMGKPNPRYPSAKNYSRTGRRRYILRDQSLEHRAPFFVFL